MNSYSCRSSTRTDEERKKKLPTIDDNSTVTTTDKASSSADTASDSPHDTALPPHTRRTKGASIEDDSKRLPPNSCFPLLSMPNIKPLFRRSQNNTITRYFQVPMAMRRPGPDHSKARSQAAAYSKNQKQCVRRGNMRWYALVRGRKSRLAHEKGMRAFLGERRWADFVECANNKYQRAFEQRFSEPIACAGELKLGSQQHALCPHRHSAGTGGAGDKCLKKLAAFHLDHAIEVSTIVRVWREVLGAQEGWPGRHIQWDTGLDGELLCHLFFGIRDHKNALCAGASPLWRANLHFRCGFTKSKVLPAPFCHKMGQAHPHHTLSVDDLRSSTVF